MPVEYRRMRQEDVDQALDLWISAFGGSNRPERRGRYIRLDPQYLDHTLLAVSPEGTILSTLHYWLYRLRDSNGTPQLVGCVSHVTTREEARRQGHAAALLQWAFQAMASEGCEWTLLFSSQMGIPLYERHGYRHYSHPFRHGLFTRQYPQPTSPYTITRVDQSSGPQDLSYLAPIYDAYNATRPLTRVRDSAYWQAYFPMLVARMFEDHNGALYTATSANGDLCGYLLARFSTQEEARKQYNLDQTFTVIELCALPHHPEALAALLSAALHDTLEGNVGGYLFLPYEEPINAIAQTIFGQTLTEQDDRSMFARPLSPNMTHDHIQAIFSTPGAIFWPIDDF